MPIRHLSLLFAFVIAAGHAFPQKKFEKEYRLHGKKVPDRALQFIRSLPETGKVRWYKEEGLTRWTVEAKFRIGENQYSVEFDSLGNLEDVELLASMQDLPGGAREKLLAQLSSGCRNYRIKKVQIQYSGSMDLLRECIITHDPLPEVRINFEIVYHCRSAGHVRMFELTTGDDGAILRRDEIMPKNTDNLED